MNAAVSKSMATQVRRVNGSRAALLAKIEDQQQTIASLRIQLRSALASRNQNVAASAEYISASEFARRHQVAVSTITRKYHAGKLKGYDTDTGYIYICADEVYVKGSRKKA